MKISSLHMATIDEAVNWRNMAVGATLGLALAGGNLRAASPSTQPTVSTQPVTQVLIYFVNMV